jgi:hypothetical protein
MNQAELFDVQRDPARVCSVCGSDLRTDKRGILRHKAGEGRRCDEFLSYRARFGVDHPDKATASAHFSTKTGATGEPKL